jgi:glutamate N-acetyltransferase / amino-acid N-acetyltransferase
LLSAGEEHLEVVEAGTATSPLGFRAGAVACGLKQSNNLDLALLVSDRECEVAGLFTRNQVAAAPVMVDRETLAANRRHIRGVVANAGNANACTGEVGLANAREMQAGAARLLGWRPEQMLVLSTGVIGVPLDMAGWHPAFA